MSIFASREAANHCLFPMSMCSKCVVRLDLSLQPQLRLRPKLSIAGPSAQHAHQKRAWIRPLQSPNTTKLDSLGLTQSSSPSSLVSQHWWARCDSNLPVIAQKFWQKRHINDSTKSILIKLLPLAPFLAFLLLAKPLHAALFYCLQESPNAINNNINSSSNWTTSPTNLAPTCRYTPPNASWHPILLNTIDQFCYYKFTASLDSKRAENICCLSVVFMYTF